jgi:hypothetical protein
MAKLNSIPLIGLMAIILIGQGEAKGQDAKHNPIIRIK